MSIRDGSIQNSSQSPSPHPLSPVLAETLAVTKLEIRPYVEGITRCLINETINALADQMDLWQVRNVGRLSFVESQDPIQPMSAVKTLVVN